MTATLFGVSVGAAQDGDDREERNKHGEIGFFLGVCGVTRKYICG
jgi:hypothetical protein